MATATNYSLVFVGQSGRTYSVSGYTADTAGAINTFSTSGLAGASSLQYFRTPENMTLVDFSIKTGTTQVAGILTENGAIKNGCLLDYVTFVSTNANRPKLAIPFPAGTLVGANTI